MPSPRRLDLDGLRGLAVLLVVGFHAGVPALRGAFVAVDVFFVLSGFFLATTLAKRIATGDELRPAELVARRLWRLVPLLALVLLGTLATTLLYAPIDRAAAADHVVPVSLFAGNLAFAAGGVNYFRAGENPLLHTWTLGIEMQLALLLPFLVLLLARWGERRAGDATGDERRLVIVRTVMLGLGAAAALSFALAVIINDASPMWAYFGPHTRLWSFCAGALMAFLTGGGQSVVGVSPARLTLAPVIGLGLLIVPALFYTGTLAYPGIVALAPVGGTMLLLAGGEALADSVPGRFLSSAPLVELGRVSYAWYLWHWPLMVLGGEMLPEIGVVGKLAFGLLGLGAAFLTHRLLERPAVVEFLEGQAKVRPVLLPIAASVALALIGFTAARSAERAVAQGEQRRYLDARSDWFTHACWDRAHDRTRGTDCSFGDTRSGVVLALLGDSHAAHWLGGLDAAGAEHGWRIEPFVMGACPVADLRGLLTGPAARMYEKCEGFQERTLRRLAAERPDAVILSNSDNYLNAQRGLMGVPGLSEAAWTEGLRRTYARYDSLGIQVIVFRALPWVPFDVPSCLSRRAAGLPFATDCAFVPDRALIAKARRAQENAARGLDVRFVDVNDGVCGAGPARCATARDGLILYTDDNHISGSFSRSLSPQLGERIAAALRR